MTTDTKAIIGTVLVAAAGLFFSDSVTRSRVDRLESRLDRIETDLGQVQMFLVRKLDFDPLHPYMLEASRKALDNRLSVLVDSGAITRTQANMVLSGFGTHLEKEIQQGNGLSQ